MVPQEPLASFAMGCFWSPEELFRNVAGVTHAVVGYTGGVTKNPTYHEIHERDTGHAEAIQITFDPQQVSYEQLLQLFWANHNPTTPNQDGPNIGSQYRSVIFYHTPEQQQAAEHSKAELTGSGKWKRPVVTEIVPAQKFYPAEEYHQRYLQKRGLERCHM